MSNRIDHDQIITNKECLNHIRKSVDRIESKIDGWPGFCSAKHEGVDKRINGKISWSHFAILLSAIGIVITLLKYAPVLAALL